MICGFSTQSNSQPIKISSPSKCVFKLKVCWKKISKIHYNFDRGDTWSYFPKTWIEYLNAMVSCISIEYLNLKRKYLNLFMHKPIKNVSRALILFIL